MDGLQQNLKLFGEIDLGTELMEDCSYCSGG